MLPLKADMFDNRDGFLQIDTQPVLCQGLLFLLLFQPCQGVHSSGRTVKTSGQLTLSSCHRSVEGEGSTVGLGIRIYDKGTSAPASLWL